MYMKYKCALIVYGYMKVYECVYVHGICICVHGVCIVYAGIYVHGIRMCVHA